MRAALLAVGALVVLAPRAHADDTFESKAASAQRVKRVEDLVWALTATCDQGDDTQNRQCRIVRNRRAAELAGATLLVDAAPEAFRVDRWDAQKKSVPLFLDSCIRCKGIEVDGKTWFVVGGSAPTWDKAKFVTAALYNNARPFDTEASAKEWTAAATDAHVQLLVQIGPKAKQQIDKKNVLALDVVGYRAFNACAGAIVIASPSSGAVEPDKKACTAPAR